MYLCTGTAPPLTFLRRQTVIWARFPVERGFVHIVDISKWVVFQDRANLCEIKLELHRYGILS
jgi:hypothetical protein